MFGICNKHQNTLKAISVGGGLFSRYKLNLQAEGKELFRSLSADGSCPLSGADRWHSRLHPLPSLIAWLQALRRRVFLTSGLRQLKAQTPRVDGLFCPFPIVAG